jgi:hypothetical protein
MTYAKSRTKMMSSVKGALRMPNIDWNILSPLNGQCREE